MTSFCLSEFDPSLQALSRLHVIITLPESISGEFFALLEKTFQGVELRYDRGNALLLLVADREHEAAVLLPRLADAIWEFCQNEGEVKPEILETRMAVPEGQALGRRESFSRFIAINEEEGGGQSKRFQLKMAGSTVFGSGTHPSTRLAVKALEHLFTGGAFPARVIDVGCGSGILSFCSCLFGAGEVKGIDISSEAVTTAEKNKGLNAFAGKLVFVEQQLPEVTGTYDLIIANVTAAVMSGMLRHFTRLVDDGGYLVLSGLLGRQQKEMAEEIRDLGFRVVGVYGQEKWRAMLLAAVESRP